ncbi:MAG: hypothetical protein JNJ83_02890 [Verrucomicrobiaceae bacterium]|nr:hypothetical protein [Verrucomicrobiaceae bacterium]
MNPSHLLIATNELQRGDVLLMHGGGKDAKAISHFTGGPYSHAALCLGGHGIWESDGDIIGTKFMVSVGYCHRDGRQLLLATIPGNPESCEVYRHSGMAEISEERFMEVFAAEVRRFHGMNYSEYRRLLPMVKAGWFWKRILYWVASRRDRRAVGKKVHGAFCSELVASFYARLGLSLFDEPKELAAVTPLTLAQSKLEKQDGLVLESKSVTLIPDPDNDFQNWAFLHRMDPATGEQVDIVAQARNRQLLALRQLEAIRVMTKRDTAALKVILQEKMTEILKGFQEQGERILSHVECCAALQDPGTVRRAQRLMERYMALAPDVHQMHEYVEEDHDRYERTMRSINALKVSSCRCELLLCVRISRGQTAKAAGWRGWSIKWKLKSLRRKNIRLFRRARQLMLPLMKAREKGGV